jgi:hypothetical protein
MTTTAQAFRFNDDDTARLEALTTRLDCSKVEVLRKGLIALPILLDDGYNLDWVHGPGLILRRTPAGGTKWFKLDGDRLVLIGEDPAPTKGAGHDEG